MPEPTRHVARPFGRSREVVSIGLHRSPWGDLYHTLLTTSWRRFFALLLVAYLVVNAAFALAYHALGDAIENADPASLLDDFFFSVQTLATIGYGRMSPRTIGANAIVAVEALLGMIGLAVTTGLVFARFSRPMARVLFSEVAVVAPLDGVTSLMFRLANARGNQIAEARLKLAVVRNELTGEGQEVRRVHDLRLRRSEHPAFALTWTAVHPLDEASPLRGKTADELRASVSDFIVSLIGLDEGLSQTIVARHSYTADDIVWGARFADILTLGPERTVIDYRHFHETVPLADASRQPAGRAPHAFPAAPPSR